MEDLPKKLDPLRWVATAGVLGGLLMVAVDFGQPALVNAVLLGVGIVALAIYVVLAVQEVLKSSAVRRLEQFDSAVQSRIISAAKDKDTKEVRRLLQDAGLQSRTALTASRSLVNARDRLIPVQTTEGWS